MVVDCALRSGDGRADAHHAVIAQCCGLDDRAAEQIEQIEHARNQHSMPFHSVDELLVFAELDVSVSDLIRERAVVYS
ncbi:hypothetical protein ACFFQW_16665 [Umezawaea endophytica]|uniref:Uncharacterized protein n=1 Tax=Umezawaea endophytica TaxID=1654476 RepID=A0A9X2VQB8_9PSEU|nr:hypothetical protein [Umezawaea endophytica]MCS7480384.1 hypothetical protein [Umezawaea endophytica]